MDLGRERVEYLSKAGSISPKQARRYYKTLGYIEKMYPSSIAPSFCKIIVGWLLRLWDIRTPDLYEINRCLFLSDRIGRDRLYRNMLASMVFAAIFYGLGMIGVMCLMIYINDHYLDPLGSRYPTGPADVIPMAGLWLAGGIIFGITSYVIERYNAARIIKALAEKGSA